MANDENGIPWINQERMDESIDKHQKEHRGKENYLEECKDMYNALKANNFDTTTATTATTEKRGTATITFIGMTGAQENNREFVIRGLGKSGEPRTMVIAPNGEVVHYAKQKER